MPAKRAAAFTIALAVAALLVSGVIASVHRQLAINPGSASFCNVNESVDCDLVLTSEYAYFVGVPVAWWALLAYLFIAALALAAGWATRVSQRRQAAGILFAAAVASVLYSAYLAYISLFELRTVCLLCATLYVINLGLLVTGALVYAAARAVPREQEAWQSRTRIITGGAVAAVVLLLAVVAWKASSGDATMSPEEFQAQHPDFYDRYMKLPVVAVDSEGGHSKGDPSASVTIVEFSDFECGHCARAYQTLKRVLPRFKKDVQLRFHHFPLDAACNPAIKQSFHKYACLAAMAAECAGAQGRFWEYHDLLFEHQSALDRDSLLDYAGQVGIDRQQFLACLDSDAARRGIQRDVAEGIRLAIESTPTFFLNGRQVAGAKEPAELEQAIRLERAARTAGGDAPPSTVNHN